MISLSSLACMSLGAGPPRGPGHARCGAQVSSSFRGPQTWACALWRAERWEAGFRCPRAPSPSLPEWGACRARRLPVRKLVGPGRSLHTCCPHRPSVRRERGARMTRGLSLRSSSCLVGLRPSTEASDLSTPHLLGSRRAQRPPEPRMGPGPCRGPVGGGSTAETHVSRSPTSAAQGRLRGGGGGKSLCPGQGPYQEESPLQSCPALCGPDTDIGEPCSMPARPPGPAPPEAQPDSLGLPCPPPCASLEAKHGCPVPQAASRRTGAHVPGAKTIFRIGASGPRRRPLPPIKRRGAVLDFVTSDDFCHSGRRR